MIARIDLKRYLRNSIFLGALTLAYIAGASDWAMSQTAPTAQAGQTGTQTNFATVTLQDETQITGLMNHNPHTGVLTLAHVNPEGQRIVDTINPAYVKDVKPAQPDQKTMQALQNPSPMMPPIETVVYGKQGNVHRGQMMPSQNPSVIVLKGQGQNQPVQIAWQDVVRVSQVEHSQSAAQQPAQQPYATQPGAGQQQPAQQQQAMQQQQQAPPQANISLTDGSVLSGVVVPNPGMGLVTILSVTQEERLVVDYVQSRFVQKIEPVEEKADASIPQKPLQEPIQAKLWLITGETVEGQYVPHQQVGLLALIPEGKEQPVIYPMHYVPRMRLIQGDSQTTSANGAAQPPQGNVTMGDGSAEQSKQRIAQSTYTHIPIQSMPSEKVELPSAGTPVRLQTNLGQTFVGVIQNKAGNWVSLKTSKVMDMEVSPPRISIINANHVISVDEQ